MSSTANVAGAYRDRLAWREDIREPDLKLRNEIMEEVYQEINELDEVKELGMNKKFKGIVNHTLEDFEHWCLEKIVKFKVSKVGDNFDCEVGTLRDFKEFEKLVDDFKSGCIEDIRQLHSKFSYATMVYYDRIEEIRKPVFGFVEEQIKEVIIELAKELKEAKELDMDEEAREELVEIRDEAVMALGENVREAVEGFERAGIEYIWELLGEVWLSHDEVTSVCSGYSMITDFKNIEVLRVLVMDFKSGLIEKIRELHSNFSIRAAAAA